MLAGGLLPQFALLQRKPIGRFRPRQFAQLTLLARTLHALQHSFYIGLAFTSGERLNHERMTGIECPAYCWRTLFIRTTPLIQQNARLYSGLCGRHGGERQQRPDFSFNLPGRRPVVLAAFILSAAIIFSMANVSVTVDSMVMTGYQLGIGGLGTGHWRLRFWRYADDTWLLVGDFSLPDALVVSRFCAMGAFTKYNRVGMIGAV